MNKTIKTSVLILFLNSSVYGLDKSPEEKKEDPKRTPASSAVLVAQGSSVRVYRFEDTLGKPRVCYFTDSAYNSGHMGASVICYDK